MVGDRFLLAKVCVDTLSSIPVLGFATCVQEPTAFCSLIALVLVTIHSNVKNLIIFE